MKKILVLIGVVLLLGNIAFGQVSLIKSVRWYSLSEAMELNKKQPRKILIDIYTDWCGWCKRMDRETFTNDVIAEYLNTNYYPVKFNAESVDTVVFAGHKFGNPGRTHEFAMALFQANKQSPGYPAIAYLTENLQLIGVVPGYLTPAQIEPILNYLATDKYKSVSMDEYQKTFVSKLKK